MFKRRFSIKQILAFLIGLTICIWSYFLSVEIRTEWQVNHFFAVLDGHKKNYRIDEIARSLDERSYSIVERKLKNRYPFVSITKRLRLAEPRNVAIADLIGDTGNWPQENWNSIGASSLRYDALKELHSEEVEDFIKRSGFGLMRMPRASVYDLAESKPQKSHTLKSTARNFSADFGQEITANDSTAPSSSSFLKGNLFETAHWHSTHNFANMSKNGFVKSTEEVAGFQPHFVNIIHPNQKDTSVAHSQPKLNLQNLLPKYEQNDKVNRWTVDRMDLVSLLVHNKPQVYLSNSLPNMEDLSDHKTRNLDPFETSALKRLKKGEHFVARREKGKVIMMGAIRARTSCRRCHDAKYRELLGAFSYELTERKGDSK